jgi:RNA polymerase sigma factor (sigma-70 family)
MPANNRSPEERSLRGVLVKMLGECQPLIEQWCAQAGLERWGISTGQFSSELARCAESKFRSGAPTPEGLVAHVSTLHLEDLALACACVEGVPEAWECFVATYRGYLRACAGAMLKRSTGSPEAQELADSLFAELYGLRDGSGVEKRGSLLRYFHGRSTLKTWLRAVLAQRHVDKIRAERKFEKLDDEDGHDEAALKGVAVANPPFGLRSAPADPHRARYLSLFTGALQTALKNLDPPDAERLRMYYAEEKKLAEIGRVLGEHESSVSRHLEKVRRSLRQTVEEMLRAGGTAALVDGETRRDGLSDEEIALCFEYAAEDAPIDLDQLFSPGATRDSEHDSREI